jgi:cytoskeletal protein CcmA (bactofilin family)
VFPTTDLDTPFAEGAESVLSSSSSEAGVTELPGTATNAYIFGSSKEKPKYYAVSALINGIPILEFPVIPATAGAEPPASLGEGGSGSGGVLGNNESSPGSENGMGTPAPTCPKHMITLPGGITVEASCFHVSGNAATATGHIRVNGLDIVASGSVTLNTSTLELDSSGQVDVYAGSLHIYHGALSWKFTAQLSLKAPGNLKIKGLPVGGEITVSLEPGGVHAVANAMIGTATFEVSGQIDLELTLKDGLKLNSFALELASDVPIKSLVVKKAKLAYHHTSAGDVWDGVVAVELPAKGPTVQGELVLTNGSVSEVALNVSGINKPIGEVVFLQSLGLKVDFIPRLSATGSIGLSAGPKILGHTAASLDGSLTATIGDPFVLEAAGTLDMIDQKVASAWVKATIPGGVSFSGEISRSFAVIEITGGISGSITPHSFEAQGHVKIDAHVVSASGDALVNNTGLAGCASAQVLWATVSIGASHRWSGENSVFADTCGFGRLQSALGASSSALPGPPTIVHVPAHTRQINLVVHGTNGSPEVSLVQGKNNVLIMPNTTGAFGRAVYVALADPSLDATYIAIAGPEAGTLDVASPAGQPRFASIGSALPLPSPHVRIAVHSVGTRRYRLSWSSRKIPGQTLLFQDVNARGQVQVLSTTRSDGRIAFTALDNGANGPQKLRVVVDQDGLTREVLAGPVFHPAPVHVGKPHVNMRLKGRTAVITWSAAQNATSYEVSVSTSDGRHLFFAVGARDRSVRIPGASRVAASVRGVGAGMELGPLGTGKTTSQKPTPKNHARSKKA